MNALIVYDSFFGNTEKIAQAIGQALGLKGNVATLRFNEVTAEAMKELDYLIVGSPTRAFKASEGITKFLKDIPNEGIMNVKVAAFDTRVSIEDVNNRFLTTMVKLFGYAAEPIAKRLQKKGGIQVSTPEGFIVNGTEGPLKEGELERAAAWGKQIIEV